MAKWWEKDITFQRPGLFCDQKGILFSSWFRRDLVVVIMACLSLVYWLIVNNFDSLQQRVRGVCFGGVPSGVSCFQSWRNLLKGSWLQWEESVNFAQSSVVNAKCFNKSSMQLQLNVVSGLKNVQWENII